MRCPFHHRDAVLIAYLSRLIERIDTMSAELDRLQASVANLSTTVDAAVAKIAAPHVDPAALAAIADSVDAHAARLNAALATPPAP